MIDHDRHVGELLDLLDELGIAENTIVIYSTDNGPHMNTWPDAGMTPFRSEKNTNWEGAFRVPQMIRWPGRIPAGVVSNEIVSHHDWLPTFLAAAGAPDIVEQLKAGHTIGDTTYKVHIDGYNLLPYLTGEVDTSPRPGFVYFSDDGDVLALRFDNWKVVFMEQRVQGTLRIWAEPFVPCASQAVHLRTDPSSGPTSPPTANNVHRQRLHRAGGNGRVTHSGHLQEFPPVRRRPVHHRPGGGQARERAHRGR